MCAITGGENALNIPCCNSLRRQVHISHIYSGASDDEKSVSIVRIKPLLRAIAIAFRLPKETDCQLLGSFSI